MKVLIIDIETTHPSPKYGYLLELGIAELDLDNGRTEIIYDELLREPGCTDSEILKSWFWENSTIEEEDMFRAQPIDQELGRIQGIINLYPGGATAYNSDFDFRWLESRGFTFPHKLPDPMKAAKYVCRLSDRRGHLKNPTVEEAWAHFFPEEPYKEKHRGGDDSLHESKIYYELYKRGAFRL